MQLEGVEIRLVDLALRAPIRSAAGEHRRRPLIYVRVVADGVEGWGECGALATAGSVDPSVGEVWASINRAAGAAGRLIQAAAARGGALPDATAVADLVTDDAVERMAGAAVEMAVFDAELRAAGESLAARLGVGGRSVAAGALVGIPADRDIDALVAAVAEAAERGYRRVRLKIEPRWDVEPVRAARDAFPGLPLQADANGAYRLGSTGPDDARRLRALDPFGLDCVEQPMAPADLGALAELAGLLETPVALDESLTSTWRVAEALRSGACEVACLKPARLGGLVAAQRAQGLCAEAGTPAFVGGLFESGLGRTANAALAALPGFTLPSDLSAPADYLEVDPAPSAPPVRGWVALAPTPGVGPAPDPAVLEACTAEVRWFAAG